MDTRRQLLERYRFMLPIALNKEFYDVVVLHPNYSDDDLVEARKYAEEIRGGIRLKNGEEVKIVLYDDFAPEIGSKLARIAEAIKRCSLRLIYITANFETSHEREQSFFTETALAETLENPLTRDTLIPVYSDSVVNPPTMFLSLTPIYRGSDMCELDKIGKVIEDKLSIRKALEEDQEVKQLEWAVTYHQKQNS